MGHLCGNFDLACIVFHCQEIPPIICIFSTPPWTKPCFESLHSTFSIELALSEDSYMVTWAPLTIWTTVTHNTLLMPSRRWQITDVPVWITMNDREQVQRQHRKTIPVGHLNYFGISRVSFTAYPICSFFGLYSLMWKKNKHMNYTGYGMLNLDSKKKCVTYSWESQLY